MDVATLSLELEEKRRAADIRLQRLRDILQSFGPRASPAYDRLIWHLDEAALEMADLNLAMQVSDSVQVQVK